MMTKTKLKMMDILVAMGVAGFLILAVLEEVLKISVLGKLWFIL